MRRHEAEGLQNVAFGDVLAEGLVRVDSIIVLGIYVKTIQYILCAATVEGVHGSGPEKGGRFYTYIEYKLY